MQKSFNKQDTQQNQPEAPRSADERFKLIARATNDVFWDWDLVTNAAWRSAGASETFGYPPEELNSDINSWINRIHPEDRKRVHESIQSAIREGKEFWRDEYRFLCKDGSYAEVLDRGYVAHNAEGKPIRMAGTLSDISTCKERREINGTVADIRRLLEAILNNVPDRIYFKDTQSRFIKVSKSVALRLGVKDPALAVGKTDFDFNPAEKAKEYYQDDQQVVQTGQPLINKSERHILPNGEVNWTSTTKVPLRNREGEIIGLVGINRDITEQKRVEAALRESHEQLEQRVAERAAEISRERQLLRTLVDNLPDVIYAKDAAGRKILSNPADVGITRFKTEAEVIGKTDFDFFPRDIAEKFFADDQKVMQGEAIINREEYFLDEKNQKRWLLTSKLPLRDQNKQIIGLVGIGRDITDKRHLEEQLLRAQRMESLGRLATGIAHDLNNILAPILISIALLRQKVQDDEGLAMLTRLEASAKRGADIVKQVLGFGRGLEGQRMPVNPQQLIKDVIRVTTQTFSKSIQIEMDVAPDAGLVSGDMTQLHQVLLNLCLNARDAMPNGGKLKLSVRNFAADAHFVSLNPEAKPMAYVRFEVADTGLGIPSDIRDRIFEPFFTTKELGKGAGLGLSTALSIVKSHGGFILAESEPGKGATFQVYLPVMTKADFDKAAAQRNH